ncbi:hypothetical protein M408DRAFT_331427, partial [Serendipita vermifera MAFF 305830]
MQCPKEAQALDILCLIQSSPIFLHLTAAGILRALVEGDRNNFESSFGNRKKVHLREKN